MTSSPTRYIDGPQGRIRVDDGGQGGVPVFFVPGGAGWLDQWRAQLDHLRPGRRAVALELRGLGRADRPRDGDYTLEAMADDVLAVADALHLGRFVVVGHSYGTMVAAALAAVRPERLAGLVLVDGGYWIPNAEDLDQLRVGLHPANCAAYLARWFEPILANARPETRAEVLAELRATPREVFAGLTYGYLGYDVRKSLAGFPGPKLAIAAEMSDHLPIALHRNIQGLPVRVMKGVSHWLMMDAPQEFSGYLDEFLAAIPGQ